MAKFADALLMVSLTHFDFIPFYNFWHHFYKKLCPRSNIIECISLSRALPSHIFPLFWSAAFSFFQQFLNMQILFHIWSESLSTHSFQFFLPFIELHFYFILICSLLSANCHKNLSASDRKPPNILFQILLFVNINEFSTSNNIDKMSNVLLSAAKMNSTHS